MKPILRLSAWCGPLVLILSAGLALGQTHPRPAPPAPPTLPGSVPVPPPPGAMDPTTGLPLEPNALPEWKDPDWPDPAITLTNVSYDNLPLSEVAANLRDQFKESFDILLPVNLTLPSGSEAVDPGSIPIRLRLKNVTASEVFNAMNLVFDNDRTPLRWELKLNGKRPIALLRILAVPPRPESLEPVRMVYFVGDLLGNEKPGGMSIDEVAKTVDQVCQMTYGKTINVQFHKAAQLVVVSGSRDQVVFVEQMLAALREKAALGRQSAAKTNESSKPADASAPK